MEWGRKGGRKAARRKQVRWQAAGEAGRPSSAARGGMRAGPVQDTDGGGQDARRVSQPASAPVPTRHSALSHHPDLHPAPLPLPHTWQAALAAGLLQLLPLKPRTVGLLGVVASAMNCYLLLPAYPKPVAAAKAKSA